MKYLWGLAAGIILAPCLAAAENPPVAQIVPFSVTTHGDVRVDNYHWLRDDRRTAPAVMDYLNAENRYAAQQSQRWQGLTETILQEMSERQSQDNYAQPWQNNDFTYQSTFAQHANYPQLLRQKNGSSRWEKVLDARERSKGHAYYSLSRYAVSEDNRYLAIAEDTRGDGQNQISVLDISRQQWLPQLTKGTSGEVVFSQDGRSLFYVANHPQTLTPYRVMQHWLTGERPDRLVYEEQDDSLYTGIARSASGAYLIITLSGNDTSEVRVLPLNEDNMRPQLIRPRIKGQEYYLDHNNDRFTVRSNHADKNFGIYTFHQPEEAWQSLVAPAPDSEIENFFLFDQWLVVARRAGGQTRLAKLQLASGEWQNLNFPDQSYMVRPGSNSRSGAGVFNYIYSSLAKPLGYYQWDLRSNQTRLVHQKQLPGVDLSRYQSEFVTVVSRDGESIPVSLVYRRDLFHHGKNPLLVYGYGAYGISVDVAFSAPRLSLLDRGFVFAIAHVRGGGEKGIDWYLNGKKNHKQHSINDFNDAAQGLIAQGFGAADRLYAMGGSAGGLLVAAAVNQQPQQFRAVVMQVPFVDVLNTMLDSSLPLTQQEFDEWGNPADAGAWQAIKAWSPYDNLRTQPYPNMLVTSGLYDTRVPYWEAAKYIARLRTVNTRPHPLLLLTTNMQAGHGGSAGRYARLKDSAQAFSFLIYSDNNNNHSSGAPR
ncbi:S9 family peptidase [Erwinia sorbitola]|uniref:Prolyl oligopeptidase family serine peptidase n=1 Tax=Erwinia sorbitola TaxID=2681984 RepID=A0ABW9RBY7_9GAMM|nr:S9 family peptidase [Erwinia sorbitola]MTD27507.1 prolyl oligopeptidase family serine peptidase [Erwinia sorbitola]